MKTMFLSDLFTLRRSLPQLIFTAVVFCLIMTFFSLSAVTLSAALTALLPMVCLMNLCMYDDLNGWGSYRLTLPLSRRDVVWGRYLTVLLITAGCAVMGVILGLLAFLVASWLPGTALAQISLATDLVDDLLVVNLIEITCAAVAACLVVLITAIVVLPLVMKMGVTKAVRIIPLFVVVLLFGGFAALDSFVPGFDVSYFDQLLSTPESILIGCGILALVVLALYPISATLAVRIYQTREL